LLPPDELPTSWGNLKSELPDKLPLPLDPKTLKPASLDFLYRIFPKQLVQQELSDEQTIKIPEEVYEGYLRIPRPTPLVRAKRLEKYLNTPAEIYYKAEHLSPTGAHKLNVALPAAYYSKEDNAKRVVTLTGAGQWGSALAMASSMLDMGCTVYMVKVSYEQKPGRRIMMQLYGADVYPSPSDHTAAGRRILKENPGDPGSMGVAVGEALEDALGDPNAKYCTGSLWNYTMINQSLIGLEAKKQFDLIDVYPDIVCGCIGGGSNLAGMSYPFMIDKLKGKVETDFIAIEPKAIPSTTRGTYTYDHGDSAELTPLIKMFTVGHKYANPPIHAGGLRHHGKAPLISYLIHNGFMRSVAYHQNEVFEAASIFARTEGIVVAPETAHTIKSVVDEALKCKKTNMKKVIVFALTGHGLLDLASYDKFLKGDLIDWEPTEIKVQRYI
jgi:tryptophan synthase beta chain